MFGSATNLAFVSIAPVEFYRKVINSWEQQGLAQTITSIKSDWKDYTVLTTATLIGTASSGLPVFYNSLTKENCKVIGNTVTFMTPGTCSISADADGTPTYNAAPQRTVYLTQANSVDQGGLTWLPIYPHTRKSYVRASNVCSPGSFNGINEISFYGHDDWRLPTKRELISLARSGALDGQGWLRYYTWSSQKSVLYDYETVDLRTPEYNSPRHDPESTLRKVPFTCVRKN